MNVKVKAYLMEYPVMLEIPLTRIPVGPVSWTGIDTFSAGKPAEKEEASIIEAGTDHPEEWGSDNVYMKVYLLDYL